jgi:hypothetical protein
VDRARDQGRRVRLIGRNVGGGFTLLARERVGRGADDGLAVAFKTLEGGGEQ